jgi:hypothetical protein
VRLEQLTAGHGRVAALGGDRLDADPVPGEHGRHVAHDAGVVGAHEVDPQVRPVVGDRPGRLVSARVDGDVEEPVETGERRSQRIGPVVGHRDDDDPRELPGELGHLALLPVAAVDGDGLGEGLDETGAIVSDDGEHESGHACIQSRA